MGLRLAAWATLVAVVALPSASASAARAGTIACARYAATGGDDRAAGTLAAPFRSVDRLVVSLRPGETGCLEPGTYRESVRIAHGGRPGRRIVLRSADPADRATIVGRVYVTKQASDVTIRGLELDGVNAGRAPSPTVDAARITFLYDDVTNDHTAICFALGSPSAAYGPATDVVIDHSRIHDCGRLPPNNTEHGIYVAVAHGTRITNDYIYDNADRGVQLFPDAQDTTVAHDVIDGNGEGVIISGDDSTASSGNRIVDDVISNSTVRYDVEYSWGSKIGTGNVVEDNCVWHGREGTIERPVGFVSHHNVVADPEYADRATKDFALRPGSPCAAYGPVG
jgi:hypothetical protein